MNKPFIVSLLALMTAISGVTYYSLQHQGQFLRKAGTPPTAEVYENWLWWLQTYGKTYEAEEIPLKFTTFKDNYVYIQAHNAQKKSFTLGLNQFADFSNPEFAALQQGTIFASTERKEVELTNTAANSVDWRAKGAVTPVKNQGQCGSCWAFSTTGSLEGLNFITNGDLLSFSEQQLVDCSTSFGNQGCNGGLMDDAFKYVEKFGIELESAYPYAGSDQTCTYNKADVKFTIHGYHDVKQNDSSALQQAVNVNPVSIAIEADKMSFQFYTSGVYDDAACGTSLDHGVLLVGYGSSAGKDYWIVKNSWAATWGNKGYIWIEYDLSKKSDPGICGINMCASYPTA